MSNTAITRKGGLMVDINKIKKEIVELLKPLRLDKIILFGSYAYGTPHDDSDIDMTCLARRYKS